MKESPLLMTPENGQKSHDGRKTHTRRLNGLDEINASPSDWAVLCHSTDDQIWRFAHKHKTVSNGGGIRSIKCPYGVAGDRLWLREAFSETREGPYIYKGWGMFDNGGDDWKWTPAIHMPRVACRTVVEITELRVERVKEITQDDCIAEGCGSHHTTPREEFKKLWESINGKASWEANPWVWVIGFKKVEDAAPHA